jgi:hypothetical protein
MVACLGQDGATEASITRRTGLRQDHVSKTLGRLLDYGLVRERRPLGASKTNRAGVRFYMDDFYLNFYFQVLLPLESRIRSNERGLLFPAEVIASREGYYIPDFSGRAFELLIADVLEQGRDSISRRTPTIFDKLSLRGGGYQCGTYWDPGVTQVDLVVVGEDDRELRIIEAKWISRSVDAGSPFPGQILEKRFGLGERDSWRRSHHLVLSAGHSPGFAQRARERGIGVIELRDLF